jgi:hypothetical protein
MDNLPSTSLCSVNILSLALEIQADHLGTQLWVWLDLAGI